MKPSTVNHRSLNVNGLSIFYREAGSKDAPVILLLHGYPTSSHMFRNLIPILSAKYHVIAPDLPGFGFTDRPGRDVFAYTFNNLTTHIQGFVDQLGLRRFAIYVFDYGAPVGYRLTVANPEKITAIISQNGNAYLEGLSDGWNAMQKYWAEPTSENRNALKMMVEAGTTKWQYLTGVADPTLVAPESYTLDQHFLDQPGNVEIQLDLIRDYASNVAAYPIFQQYFRDQQPAFLAVWGDKDPFFLPPGAEAFKRDMPGATVKFFDTGHFALETHVNEIGAEILAFLGGLPE
jgi:pimeloyl-ACP methyl ester carboxylesterase